MTTKKLQDSQAVRRVSAKAKLSRGAKQRSKQARLPPCNVGRIGRVDMSRTLRSRKETQVSNAHDTGLPASPVMPLLQTVESGGVWGEAEGSSVDASYFGSGGTWTATEGGGGSVADDATEGTWDGSLATPVSQTDSLNLTKLGGRAAKAE